MLIATYFKRPKAPVNMPKTGGGTVDYFFTPVDPTNPESEHVADVTDPGHIQRFLQIPEGYYVAEANAALEAVRNAAANSARPAPGVTDPPAATTTAPAVAPATDPAPAPLASETPAAPDATPTPAAQADTSAPAPAADPANADKPDEAAAKVLLALPLAKFRAELKTTPRPVLAAALAIESDKGNDERATVVKHLKAALA